jgi:hypothetical protein
LNAVLHQPHLVQSRGSRIFSWAIHTHHPIGDVRPKLLFSASEGSTCRAKTATLSKDIVHCAMHGWIAACVIRTVVRDVAPLHGSSSLRYGFNKWGLRRPWQQIGSKSSGPSIFSGSQPKMASAAPHGEKRAGQVRIINVDRESMPCIPFMTPSAPRGPPLSSTGLIGVASRL